MLEGPPARVSTGPETYHHLVAITPDDKDWTWVLERPCPECGFDPAGADRTNVARRLRAQGELWAPVLARPGVTVRRVEGRWSDLEYGCHVRDVLRVTDGRLAQMLSQDDPEFANWDQDATAIEDDYVHDEPTRVARELAAAADDLAGRLEGVDDDGWARPGRRSNGSRFTVESLAVYATHDVEHHLRDVHA